MVGLGDIPERRRRAPVRALLGRGVKLRDMVGERIYQRPVQFSRLGERIEQQRLVEPPHDDDPVNRRAVLGEGDFAGRIACQPAQIEIKRWRGAAVQHQFGRARRAPLLDGREIKVGQLDRAFELVGVVAGKKHQRNMGLDPLDPFNPGPIRTRPAEKRDRLALIVGFYLAGRAH